MSACRSVDVWAARGAAVESLLNRENVATPRAIVRRWRGVTAWAAVAIVGALVMALPTAAWASTPRCMGHTATIVARPGQVRVLGTSGADVIVGNDRSNTISGRGGNDIVCARGGGDTVHGGAGNDILSTGSGPDFVRGDGGDDVVLTRHGADEVLGDVGDDVINLGRGIDTLEYDTSGSVMIDLASRVARGALGNDTVRGAETVFVSGKVTEIVGNSARNHIEITDRSPGLVVRGRGGNDFIDCDSRCPSAEIFGGDGADRIIAGNFDDTVHGGPGDDTLDGEAGDDTLIGDQGTDSAEGSTGTDTCVAETTDNCEH